MAETFSDKYDGKLTFHLQEHDGIQTTKRTMTFPLDTSIIETADWTAIKTNFDTYKVAFLPNGSLSGVIQPTGWRDPDDSSVSEPPNTLYDVIGVEVSVEHKEVFNYGDTEEE